MNAEKLKQAVARVEKSIDAAVQREITDAMADAEDLQMLLDALAERAVSPAESVPISEHPEVVELRRHDHEVATRITHALMAERDEARAKIAAAHAEGVKQERKEADDCARHQAAQIVELRKKVEEAHAEGRRSALEELHPQWLKEKGRAEAAEAERDNLNEVAEKRRKEIARLDALLAARQAPDLSQLDVCYERSVNGTKLQAVWLSDVEALLSSTAQVEPAKADGAADMEKLLQDLANWRGGAFIYFISHPTPEIKRIKEFGAVGDGVTDDTAALQAAVDSFSAQATPEGADLPNCDEKFEEAWPRIHAHGAENGWRGIALAAWKERGALAAATAAAEPVAWRWYPIQHFGYVLSDDKEVVERLRKVGQKIEPLYRAAPPQQVAPMTPEMLRAVQLRSEVGSYITANWANAYDCLQELWRVACEAQGKQVDTSGLPG